MLVFMQVLTIVCCVVGIFGACKEENVVWLIFSVVFLSLNLYFLLGNLGVS